MNLVLDFGNTRIKSGIFNKAQLVETGACQSPEELLAKLRHLKNISHCLVASVNDNHVQVLEECRSRFNTILFEAGTPVPIKNLYGSALTLGSDRLAAAVGSHTLYPDKNVLTIDAGTCIKYNFVNAHNEYLGGAISPGIPMRLKAMHEYTRRLPLVEFDRDYQKLTGATSRESILSGALIGAACEVDAMIARYRDAYQGLVAVVTGGDAPYLSAQLKSRFFTNQNILLVGLNAILNYNLEK
jgi:type III pantothenate kinase